MDSQWNFSSSARRWLIFGGIEAACINKAFDDTFTEWCGLIQQKYNNQLIAVCAVGASVNMGRISGACTEMKESQPWLIVIHYINHQLELAICLKRQINHSSR